MPDTFDTWTGRRTALRLEARKVADRLGLQGPARLWITGATVEELREFCRTETVPERFAAPVPGPAPAPAPAGGDDTARALEALRKLLGGGGVDPATVRALVEQIWTETAEARIKQAAEEALRKAREGTIEVHVGERPVVRLEGEHVHPAFDKALDCLVAKGRVLLVGPAGTGKRHDDFAFIAAANTYGGASVEYAGRMAQDKAFMSRFEGLAVEVGFDTALEGKIGAKIPKLLAAVWKVRGNVERHRIRRSVGTRTVEALAALHAVSPERYPDDPKATLERIFLGWTAEERSKAIEGVL